MMPHMHILQDEMTWLLDPVSSFRKIIICLSSQNISTIISDFHLASVCDLLIILQYDTKYKAVF